MNSLLTISTAFAILTVGACQPQSGTMQTEKAQVSPATDRAVGGPCECCEALFDGMPKTLAWETRIAPPGEPGELLEISGTIFKNDGKTPAEGVILYVYHTDYQGLYSRGSKTSECAERHGLLRGWVKTGADGRYHFRSIRPASYPNTDIEQHIHPIVKEPGLSPYWIDEFVFDDDPKLTVDMIAKQQKRGGSGVMKLTKNAGGTWIGQRNIVLGVNVQGY